jgi:trehalose synthase
MWKGTPVVGSDVGGITIQIEDGKNSYLVDSRDVKGFSDRVVELLKNPELAEKLGKNATESVREKFLITRLLSDYLDMLHEVLK